MIAMRKSSYMKSENVLFWAGICLVSVTSAGLLEEIESAKDAHFGGEAWLKPFNDKDHFSLCNENWNIKRPIDINRPPSTPARRPSFPHFTYAGKYSCEECRAITEAMLDFCRHNERSPTRVQFMPPCANSLSNITHNKTKVVSLCTDYNNFMGDLYCPMDPCDHLKTTQSHAPKAICDIARCYNVKPQVVVPPTCPVVVRSILGQCQTLRKKMIGAHSHVHLPKSTACKAFHPHFGSEACEIVYEKIMTAVSPMSVCQQATCDSMATSLEAFCSYQLNMSDTEPVVVPGWPEPIQDCDANLGGIQVEEATYGVNCTHINITNNILSSVKDHCQGKSNCTVGNRDLKNKTTAWNPTKDDDTCKPGFMLRYRCFPKAPIHVLTLPESAKYMQLPIDCIAEINRFKPLVTHPSGYVERSSHVP